MLKTKGGMIFSEIMEQPETWQQSIKLYNRERETLIWIKKAQFNQVIFIGEGASYYAAMYASEIFAGIAKIYSAAIRSSDVFSYEALPFHSKLRTLVIAISRSGRTEETLWAVEHIKKVKPDAQVISLVCAKDTPLKSSSVRVWPLEESHDNGIIPIKSFSTMLYFISLIAGALGGNSQFLAELSKIPKNIDLKHYHEIVMKMRHLGELKGIYYLGSGQNLGLAAYASLITKEMSMTPSIYMNAFEFRHNNYISVHNDLLASFILSEKTMDAELASMRDAAKMRGQILLISENLDEKIEAGVEHAIKLKTGLSKTAQAFHIIPYLQLVSFQHSISKGMNPDKPKHATEAVTYKSKPEKI